MNVKEFQKVYATILRNFMRDHLEEHDKRLEKEKPMPVAITEDGDLIPADEPLSEGPIWQNRLTEKEQAEAMDKLERDLLEHIARKDPDGKKGIYYAFMLVWLDQTRGKVIKRVEMEKIYHTSLIQHMAEADGISESGLQLKFGQLKLWVLDFFERVAKIRVPNRLKQWLKVSSEDRMILACLHIAELILLSKKKDDFVTPEEELETIRAEIKKSKGD